MPTPIEQREYSEPTWQEFSWEINRQKISGVFCELEGSAGKLKKIRLAIFVAPDADNVRIDTRRIKRIERDDTGKTKRETDDECYIVSYWSPNLRIGRLLTIPREVVEKQEDGPLFIQIEEVSVYSRNPASGIPTYKDLG